MDELTLQGPDPCGESTADKQDGRNADLAQSVPAEDIALLQVLPDRLRDQGREFLLETDNSKQWQRLWQLAKEGESEATAFFIALVDSCRHAQIAVGCVYAVGWALRRDGQAEAREALGQWVRSHPNLEIASIALDALFQKAARPLFEIAEARFRALYEAADWDAVRSNSALELRWLPMLSWTPLPPFFWQPKSIPPIKPQSERVRFVALGDFGCGAPGMDTANQKLVAAELLRQHEIRPFDFGVTVGDNFYPLGAASPDDARWKTDWEDLYGRLGIAFYATLGNHDWYGPNGPAAEILYTRRSETWCMPSPYYTYAAGPVQLFALDTTCLTTTQMLWLREELAKSTARWRVAYAHHHMYSGSYGNYEQLIAKLMPILKDQVDLYISGNIHSLQALEPQGRVHFVISGAGGVGLYPLQEETKGVLFAAQKHGFAVFEADSNRLRMAFIDKEGNPLYESVVGKD